MAKKKTAGKSKPKRTTTAKRRPKPAPLPGFEDHAIKPLEELAHQYADIRDQRMELTEQETALKANAIKLMHKYGKTVYRHDGITITLIAGDEDVKVKVKKGTDDDDDSPEVGAEFAAERRAAVEAAD